ncbi:MAG: DUF3987 domain-containing protein [Flavobacteriales bacterium]
MNNDDYIEVLGMHNSLIESGELPKVKNDFRRFFRFSFTRNLVTKDNPKEVDIFQLDQMIREGRTDTTFFRPSIDQIRSGKGDIDDLKIKEVPAVVSSGLCQERIENQRFFFHNGLLQVDIDRKDNPETMPGIQDAEDLKQRIAAQDPHIFRAFLSPSGGIKFLVPIATKFPKGPGDPFQENAKFLEALDEHFLKEYGVEIDRSVKAPASLMLLSYDPELIANDVAKVFHQKTTRDGSKGGGRSRIEANGGGDSQGGSANDVDLSKVERWVEAVEEAGVDLTMGYHDWVRIGFAFVSIIPVAGEEKARELWQRVCCFYDGYSEKECDEKFDELARDASGKVSIGTFIQACKNAGLSVGASSTDLSSPSTDEDGESEIFVTPTFDEETLDALPLFFQRIRDLVNDIRDPQEHARSQDILVLGGLSLIGACLPNTFIVHDKELKGMNISVFVCAPSAAGKGRLSLLEQIAKAIDDVRYQEYLAEWEDHDEESDEEEPKRKIFTIPANASSSALIQQLARNEGEGFLIDTEADTLSTTLEQDWGDFSHILRKVTHNEPTDKLRIDSDEDEVRFPHFSVLLSGTPKQLPRLIPSIENGLFSRFLYYRFDTKPVWRDVFTAEGWEEQEERMQALRSDLKDLNEQLREREEKLVIKWSAEGSAILNDRFSRWLDRYHEFFGRDAVAVVKRLALAANRFASIFTVLDRFFERDEKNLPEELHLGAADARTALSLIETLVEHSFTVYDAMPAEDSERKGEGTVLAMQLFDSLPDAFSTSEAKKKGGEIGLADRTVDSYLKKMVEKGVIQRMKKGHYEKLHEER